MEICTVNQSLTLRSSTEQKWDHAFKLWLSGKAANTRRVYESAWTELLTYINRVPWEISAADVADWQANMRQRRLANSTIQQRMAAISSFYSYTNRSYLVSDNRGSEMPLHHYNPSHAVPRTHVNTYGHAIYLTVPQTTAFLAAIDQDTNQGKRDYALMLTYLLTGRRNNEICNLRLGDISLENNRVYYRWTGKGRELQRYEMPVLVWHAIQVYLKATGRFNMTPAHTDDYIFIALNENGERFPNVDPDQIRPLSDRMVRRLVKMYAHRAGLGMADELRVHDLRHTAAMLRKQAGDDIEMISAMLGHGSVNVTQIYLHKLEGHVDSSWQRVTAMLGLQ